MPWPWHRQREDGPEALAHQRQEATTVDIQLDQDRCDEITRYLLDQQTPAARAALLELLREHPVEVWCGTEGRSEFFVFKVDGVGFGKVHRSRVESVPEPRR
jgi:hypothetical protein